MQTRHAKPPRQTAVFLLLVPQRVRPHCTGLGRGDNERGHHIPTPGPTSRPLATRPTLCNRGRRPVISMILPAPVKIESKTLFFPNKNKFSVCLLALAAGPMTTHYALYTTGRSKDTIINGNEPRHTLLTPWPNALFFRQRLPWYLAKAASRQEPEPRL